MGVKPEPLQHPDCIELGCGLYEASQNQLLEYLVVEIVKPDAPVLTIQSISQKA